jgi:hypothetical protein
MSSMDPPSPCLPQTVRFEKRADAGEKLSQSAHQADGCCPLPFGVLGGEKHRISPAEAERGEGSEGNCSRAEPQL